MASQLDDHCESFPKSPNHLPTQNTTLHQEMAATTQANDTHPIRTSMNPDMKLDQDSTAKTTMISQFPRSTLRFEDGDVGNPRNWSARKKCGIGSFVLLAAFVA
jgi:hypothetical protein